MTNEQTPLPRLVAARAELQCVVDTASLLLRRRIHLPSENVGLRLRFADGTSARVYRETVVGLTPEEPCVLIVEFKLRFVRGWWHRVFRWESLLNTPLFVGFPGYVSKLWVAHDNYDVYRGIYEWDGADRAEYYARCLWRILAFVCVPTSIHYKVLPALRRDELLRTPSVVDGTTRDAASAWWRPVSVDREQHA